MHSFPVYLLSVEEEVLFSGLDSVGKQSSSSSLVEDLWALFVSAEHPRISAAALECYHILLLFSEL